MKRRASLVLAALLVCASFGLAVAAQAEGTPYTNSANGYQFTLPEAWTLLSKETIDDVIAKVIKGDYGDFDPQLISQYEEQIERLDMVSGVIGDGSTNFSILYQGLPVACDNQTLIEQVCPSAIIQIKNAFDEADVVDTGSIVPVGGREFVHIKVDYTLDSVPAHLEQFYFVSDKTLYVFLFAHEDNDGSSAKEDIAQAIQGILSSFVPGA